jgi:hypothetical protein
MTAHDAFASEHAGHLLLVLGPILFCVGIALFSDYRAWLRRHDRTLDVPVVAAAALSVVAAAIHLIVCPEHFGESALYGSFFAVVTALQLGWSAVVVVRPGRRVLVAGGVGNALTVGLWALTRTAGIPLGPERGVVEAVGTLDVLCAIAEVGVVATCVWVVVGRRVATRRLATV